MGKKNGNGNGNKKTNVMNIIGVGVITVILALLMYSIARSNVAIDLNNITKTDLMAYRAAMDVKIDYIAKGQDDTNKKLDNLNELIKKAK